MITRNEKPKGKRKKRAISPAGKLGKRGRSRLLSSRSVPSSGNQLKKSAQGKSIALDLSSTDRDSSPRPTRMDRLDPTRTTTLRRAFASALGRRYARLKGLLVKMIEDDDVFGIKRINGLGANSFLSECERNDKGWCMGKDGGDSKGAKNPLVGQSVTEVDRSHSDLMSFREQLTAGEVKDGVNVVEPYVYVVEGGKAKIQKDVDAVYDRDTNSYNLVKRDLPPERIEDRTYVHGSSVQLDSVEELRPGSDFGNWGMNDYDAIYLEQYGTHAKFSGGRGPGESAWGQHTYLAKLPSDIKLARSRSEVQEVWSRHREMGRQEALEAEGYGGVVSLDVRGDVLELAVFRNVLIPVENMLINTRWATLPQSQQLKRFYEWLKQQIDREINREMDNLLDGFIRQGLVRGAGRAFDDTRKSEEVQAGLEDQANVPQPTRESVRARQGLQWYQGSKDEFLRTAFNQPVAKEKVKLLMERAYTDLNGVNEAMATSMSRVLVDGLVTGKSPRDIARELNKQVDGIGRKRAEVIARTELIRAHSEGQLTALEMLGVKEVGVAVEWSTTGDDKVCQKCSALEGVVLKIEEARGMLPRHPNCRCAWIPANVGEDDDDQVRSTEDVREAVEESAEDEPESSWWAGDPDEIDEDRPMSLLTNREGPFSYASTQFDVPEGEVKDQLEALAESVLDEDLVGEGREDQFHVTVKYGLHNDDPQALLDLVRGFGAVEVDLGRVSVFENNGEHDVVKVDVESDDLRDLNELISRLPHTDTHPDYQPHVTLAYVKPGEGAKYAGAWDGEGTRLTFDTLCFSRKDGSAEEVVINSKGSWFSGCERNDKGWCEPGSGGGGKESAKAKFIGAKVGRAEHVRAAEIENAVANMVGGEVQQDTGDKGQRDKKPYDVRVGNHSIEVKSMLKGGKTSISVHDDALMRKIDHVKETGDVFHTVVWDDRDSYEGGEHADKHSGHTLYYKRGSGRYSLSQMEKVEDEDHLKELLEMSNRELPERARGTLPPPPPVRTLRERARKAKESRDKRDRARKARLRTERLALVG